MGGLRGVFVTNFLRFFTFFDSICYGSTVKKHEKNEVLKKCKKMKKNEKKIFSVFYTISPIKLFSKGLYFVQNRENLQQIVFKKNVF